MSKLLPVVVCAFLLSLGTAKCADSTFLNPDGLYRAYFANQFFVSRPSWDQNAHYIIKIDAISKDNPNWVLIEFPQSANQSYNSSLAGQVWINLNYVVALKAYTPASGQ